MRVSTWSRLAQRVRRIRLAHPNAEIQSSLLKAVKEKLKDRRRTFSLEVSSRVEFDFDFHACERLTSNFVLGLCPVFSRAIVFGVISRPNVRPEQMACVQLHRPCGVTETA